MNVTVCVPVLNRYDCLARLVASIRQSTVQPACVIIMDNGFNYDRAQAAVGVWKPSHKFPVVIWQPKAGRPYGLAETWNNFLRATDEERIITNDDIEFAPDAIGQMIATSGAFVAPLAGGSAFSCFLLRDECLERVGLFDEAISPGYAYFEDNDYAERMEEVGIPITPCAAVVRHVHSATLKGYSPEQTAEHHRKFRLARDNFVKKRGHLPRGYQ